MNIPIKSFLALLTLTACVNGGEESGEIRLHEKAIGGGWHLVATRLDFPDVTKFDFFFRGQVHGSTNKIDRVYTINFELRKDDVRLPLWNCRRTESEGRRPKVRILDSLISNDTVYVILDDQSQVLTVATIGVMGSSTLTLLSGWAIPVADRRANVAEAHFARDEKNGLVSLEVTDKSKSGNKKRTVFRQTEMLSTQFEISAGG